MPDPHATLSIFAEVSAALAGFSGIVIAFGRRSLRSLTRLEVRRLSNLFILSGMVLISSLLLISLLHLHPTSDWLWRVGSAILFFAAAPWLIWDVIVVTRLEKAERREVNRVLLVTFDSLAVVVIALQLANVLSIAQPWPLFLALTLAIAGAFQQFILLVRMGIRDP